MAKLRKMLGDINSPECIALMRAIETQSKATLAKWAVDRAKTRYLPVYVAEGGSPRAAECIAACEAHLAGEMPLKEVKPYLRELTQIAREAEQPVLQAAARAISTGCATIQTPTNALGYLFYGAAAVAYHQAGLEADADAYDDLAAKELQDALESLQLVSIESEPNPAKINWNC